MDIEKICAALRVLPSTEELMEAEKAFYALQAENARLRTELEKGRAREAAMEEDMREIAMGYDACVYCAHCCRDGAPVYRSGEEYMAFCETCDEIYSNFAWRGMRASDGQGVH